MKKRRVIALWSDGAIWEEQFINNTKTVMSRVASAVLERSIQHGAHLNARFLLKNGYNVYPIRRMREYRKVTTKNGKA